MRLLFTAHSPTASVQQVFSRNDYVKDIKIKSLHFADSFLNVNSLVEEVAEKIFKLGKVARIITGLLAVGTFLSIFAPIAYSAWIDSSGSKIMFSRLEQRVQELEEADKKREKYEEQDIAEQRAKVLAFEAKVRPARQGKD